MHKIVKHKFEVFCKVYNLKTSATIVKDEKVKDSPFYSNDFIKMDYNPGYGGYRMDIVKTGTGERFFNSMGRKSAKEMICYLDGLIDAQSEYPFEGIVKK